MATPSRLRQVGPDVDVPTDAPNPALDSAALGVLLLSLKTLSQRAIAATRDVFTLLSVGSGFWLWFNIPDPKPTQIIALSLYALFILSANVIVRRV